MGRSNIDIRYIAISGTNLGGGEEVFKEINPINALKFKTIVAGANINLISGVDTITISGASGSGIGTITGGTNLGGGNGVFAQVNGTNLEYKTLVAGSNTTLTPAANTITIATTPAGLTKQIQYNNAGSLGASTNLTFDPTTGLTTNILKLSTVPTIGTLADNLLIRNTSTGLVDRIATTSIFTLLTANNGLTKSGTNVRLGGTLTGDTTITGGFGLNFTNNFWTFGSRTGSTALNSMVIGLNNRATNIGALAFGNANKADGLYSFAFGNRTQTTGIASNSQNYYTHALGNYSYAGGQGDIVKPTLASGIASFNHSTNNTSQVVGHGALASGSTILGGQNHNIEVGNVRASIIGGNGIKLTGTTYIDTTAVGGLAVFSTPTTDNTNDLLVWNPTTKKIGKTTRAGLGGGGATVAGANTQIQFNNLGAFGASANLSFITGSSTLNTTNLSLSGTQTLVAVPTVGTLNNNILIRNTGTGVVQSVTTTSILATLTANNGVTKSGDNVRLGGTLTGATIITSPATGSRLSFAGFPVQYTTDLSGSYNIRSLVDRGYVTGITSTLVPLATYNTYVSTTAPAQFTTTGNNGITKSGQNFRLGGALTGNTTIGTGLYTFRFDNNAWTFGSRIGTTGATSLVVGSNNTSSGVASSAFGVNTVASNTGAVAMGNNTISSGNGSFGYGTYAQASGQASLAGGEGIAGKPVLASSLGSFNHSYNNASQTIGHGAIGQWSAILGGTNHNVNGAASIVLGGETNKIASGVRSGILGGGSNTITAVSADGSVIIGGQTNLINDSPASLVAAAYNAQINTSSNSVVIGSSGTIINTGTNVIALGVNSTTLTSAFNNHTVVSSLAINTAPVAGAAVTDDVLVWNATDKKIKKVTQASLGGGGITTANNGLTINGSNVRLGGTLTGSTTIAGASFDLLFTNRSLTLGTRLAGTVGTSSMSIGTNNLVSATNSLAIGSSNNLTGVTQAFVIGNNNNVRQGIAIGNFNSIQGGAMLAVGSNVRVTANEAVGFGRSVIASGAQSFAGGSAGVGKEIIASGVQSFNFSLNSFSQTVGHGALAANSTILGGQNHNIESSNLRAAIIGGNGIKLTGSTYSDTTAVANLAVMTSPTVGSSGDDVLVRRSTTGKIFSVTQASLLPTVNNGLSKVGANIRLGGALTGNTTISGGFGLNFTNNAWTFGTRNAGTVGANSISVGQINVVSGLNSGAFGSANNISNVATGSFALGYTNEITSTASGAIGADNTVNGLECSLAIGRYTRVDTSYAFAGGKGSIVKVLSSGLVSFNFSENNGSQIVGHGALANNSAILGGVNHNIEASNVRAAIIGGNAIKLTAGYSDHVAVPNLAIFTTPVAGAAVTDDVLVWNATDKKVKKVTQASISDERLKTNLKTLESVVDKVSKLRTVEFKYNNKNVEGVAGTMDYGLIAQEVENEFPHVVKDNLVIDGDDTTYKTVEYRKLVPILFAAIKELNEKIKDLESKIK